jgi:hypothetical protein
MSPHSKSGCRQFSLAGFSLNCQLPIFFKLDNFRRRTLYVGRISRRPFCQNLMKNTAEFPKSTRKKSWRGQNAVFAFACLVVLIALFYAEEDWRGWHAWQKFKNELEVKGEKFDFASFIPSTVPDDQNFAMTPIVASSWEASLDKNGHQIQPPNANVVDRLQMTTIDYNYNNDPTNGTGSWQKSTASDLKVWQQYYRELALKTNEFPAAPQPQTPAADVLLALSKYDSAIEELRQASKLPYSRFPLNYDADHPFDTLLPHLAGLRSSSRMLQLRAIAELENDQSDKALDDVKLMLRLTDSIRSEPFLISHLVRMAIFQIALQPVWEGFPEHKWSDAQLAELELELGKLNFLADYGVAMHGEQACAVGAIDYLRHTRKLKDLIGSDGDGTFKERITGLLFYLSPSGWFYQNQLRYARVMVQSLSLVDSEQQIITPPSRRHDGAAFNLEFGHGNPYNILVRMLVPAVPTAMQRFAYSQESVDLARVGCALERYRLAHGEYPELLDALTPQFIAKLPHDIINGQSLNYRRTSDGQFVLYSVGWNETDDDGEVGLRENGSVDITKGDWVWRYPPK